jgi:hypothetical protein
MKKKLSKLITTVFAVSVWASASFAVAKHMSEESMSFNNEGNCLPNASITYNL